MINITPPAVLLIPQVLLQPNDTLSEVLPVKETNHSKISWNTRQQGALT